MTEEIVPIYIVEVEAGRRYSGHIDLMPGVKALFELSLKRPSEEIDALVEWAPPERRSNLALKIY